jgi:hypothetical protein
VHSILKSGLSSLGIVFHGGGVVLVDGVRSQTITEILVAHILEDDVAVGLGVAGTASVLGGPFDLQQGARIESHGWSPAVSSLSW